MDLTATDHAHRAALMAEMAGRLAHDINQPLTSITVYAQDCLTILQSQPCVLDDLVQPLENIITEGRRASEVVRGFRAAQTLPVNPSSVGEP